MTSLNGVGCDFFGSERFGERHPVSERIDERGALTANFIDDEGLTSEFAALNDSIEIGIETKTDKFHRDFVSILSLSLRRRHSHTGERGADKTSSGTN